MGYVGTVAAACLADSGNDVVVVDIKPTKIAQLNAGKSPVMEFGLAELIAQNVERGRLPERAARRRPPDGTGPGRRSVGQCAHEGRFLASGAAHLDRPAGNYREPG